MIDRANGTIISFNQNHRKGSFCFLQKALWALFSL